MAEDHQRISEEFSRIEELFEEDPEGALKKMVDMYPEADEAFNHEVADAIDIWIREYIDPELAEYLRQKMTGGRQDRIYAGWISSLQKE